MIQIAFWIYIFLDLLYLIIILDVILSWIMVFWINLRPKMLSDIIDPIYEKIRSIIPTTLWPLDFTPIIVLFAIYFLQWIVVMFFPEVKWLIQLL